MSHAKEIMECIETWEVGKPHKLSNLPDEMSVCGHIRRSVSPADLVNTTNTMNCVTASRLHKHAPVMYTKIALPGKICGDCPRRQDSPTKHVKCIIQKMGSDS